MNKYIKTAIAVGFFIGLITGVVLMLNIHSDLVLWGASYGKH